MTNQNDKFELVKNSNSIVELEELLNKALVEKDEELKSSITDRLAEIETRNSSNSVLLAFWKSVYTLEGVLSFERKKTVTLSRTRQKAKVDGELKTISDMVMKNPPSDGYTMLVDRGMPELTFEAIVIKHKSVFNSGIVLSAENRLRASNVDVEKW